MKLSQQSIALASPGIGHRGIPPALTCPRYVVSQQYAAQTHLSFPVQSLCMAILHRQLTAVSKLKLSSWLKTTSSPRSRTANLKSESLCTAHSTMVRRPLSSNHHQYNSTANSDDIRHRNRLVYARMPFFESSNVGIGNPFAHSRSTGYRKALEVLATCTVVVRYRYMIPLIRSS